ncbi:MAG: coproporphyrinogen III oxidase [Bacteroidia bacterium]|nr:MAG: coproporphyrinogen III oxidase [Bacteroidia bacterium]
MIGIYIHIPFCHHKCTYCDFHFSVNQKSLNKVLSALHKEIEERKNESTSTIETIYFGGGTPSILSLNQLEAILNQIYQHYALNKKIEMTIECNPEDISIQYLKDLQSLGFNRISLGIQSLNDGVLKWMGRHHTAEQSVKSIQSILQAGFENFSIDFIFGIPFYPTHQLLSDLNNLLYFFPPHISAYQLTIEPKTKLNYLLRTKKFQPSSEEKIINEFLSIQEILEKNNYCHYEVSNYAKPGFISKHNSSYWLQKPYLGFGPSAHSYRNNERRWNVANNYLYAKRVLNHEIYFEKETLNIQQQFNEYILTRLRTVFGCNLDEIEKLFGQSFKKHFLNKYQLYKDYFNVNSTNTDFSLKSNKGFLLVDTISREFFV